MIAEFITPFFLATFWTTLGCALLRLWLHCAYDRICMLWLMVVFEFTLFNRVVVLDNKLVWPVNLLVSSLALIAPVVAHLFYPDDSEVPNSQSKRFAIIYGLLLLSSSTVLTIASKNIFTDVQPFINSPAVESWFVVVVLALLFEGMSGLMLILRASKQ